MGANIEELKQKIVPIAKDYGVEAVYLFGSFARGEATEDSDYDFYIKKGRVRGLMQLIGFENILEKVLGRKVDVVTSGIRNERLLRSIERDGVLLYES